VKINKYKAWVNELKVMYVVSQINYDFDGIYSVMLSNAKLFIIHPSYKGHWNVDIIQFTGLLDKNGDEIYEGDIVTFKESWNRGKDNIIVEWDETGWSPFNKMEDIKGEGMTHTHESMFCEILGNIYEDKNILEEKQ